MTEQANDLLEWEQLLFTLVNMSDKCPTHGAHQTLDVAEELGWTPEKVDLIGRGLERRRLAERHVYLGGLNGKPLASSIGPSDRAFLEQARSWPDWASVQAAAVDWLMSAGPGSSLISRDLASTTGLHPRAAIALMEEWWVAGAVGKPTMMAPIGVGAVATGLRPATR